ncbi:hypothetical protein FQN60_002044 [Etheostoma spectabile]|uniref:Uncharacterized protein n=1 Tax=Etheostoma spectabile TaxID=54343 RepID=A0A5J5DDT7_9PERO|nr:hypothetical protein FQN60_002044 [Etheostoma spectabile]
MKGSEGSSREGGKDDMQSGESLTDVAKGFVLRVVENKRGGYLKAAYKRHKEERRGEERRGEERRGEERRGEERRGCMKTERSSYSYMWAGSKLKKPTVLYQCTRACTQQCCSQGINFV